jgi:hypothetical protein
MKTVILALSVLSLCAACTMADQKTAAAGATGAVIGAAVSDDNRLAGAALGAAAGVAAWTLLGPAEKPGDCLYRDAQGRRVIAPC